MQTSFRLKWIKQFKISIKSIKKKLKGGISGNERFRNTNRNFRNKPHQKYIKIQERMSGIWVKIEEIDNLVKENVKLSRTKQKGHYKKNIENKRKRWEPGQRHRKHFQQNFIKCFSPKAGDIYQTGIRSKEKNK